ncbi:MAG: hypothetical protein HYX60_02720 [Legionella longbeachae]|nr:hypothetical protein [Legionella longbeachae]
MKSKFKRELEQFLEKERISRESGIINELTYRLIGIKLDEEKYSTGFSLNDSWRRKEKDSDKIKFSIPSGINLKQLYKILDFFNIEREKYELNYDLTLNDKFNVEAFLIKFKQCFQNMKELEPKAMAKYKIVSAPVLESTAKETLRKYISDAYEILLSENLQELTEDRSRLVKFMIQLSGLMEKINEFPLFYKDVLKGADRIKEFLNIEEISDNKTLVSKLKMIIEGIDLYAKYHRNDSVLANLAMIKETNPFLKQYRISTETCDIIEHVILNLAGAKQNSQSKCTIDIGSDRSRLVLTYHDIDEENTQKVIDYMINLGDETAFEGYGSRRHGHVMTESRQEKMMISSEQSFSLPVKVQKIESHSIELDGKFFYTSVFPKIKAAIAKMDEEKLLSPYQHLSMELFPEEIQKLGVSLMGMFSNNIVEEEPNEEVMNQLNYALNNHFSKN